MAAKRPGRTRSSPWSEGSIFLVPQSDGRYSVGQVLRRVPQALNSVLSSYYDHRVASVAPVAAATLLAETPISIQFTTPDLLDDGRWVVVGQAAPMHLDMLKDLDELERNQFVGASVRGSANMAAFLNAFYGLEPWDAFADPLYLDKLLLHPERKPSRLVYLRSSSNHLS